MSAASWRCLLVLVVAAVAWGGAAVPVLGTSWQPIELPALVASTPLIVVAALEDGVTRHSEVPPGVRVIWRGPLQVREVIKGEDPASAPVVAWEEPLTDSPPYATGSALIWFLDPARGDGTGFIEMSHPALVRPLSDLEAVRRLLGKP